MTITDFIKKKAEDASIKFSPEYDSVDKFRERVKIYTSGFTEGVDWMKGFAEFIIGNFYATGEDCEKGQWKYRPMMNAINKLNVADKPHTTDQLLSEYIKTLTPHSI